VAGWTPKGVARDALQALIDIYQFIASAAIWIGITCLPVAIPVGIVVFLIVKGVQRVRRKKKAQKTAE
jgi:F0F1-type ATP synthase membrane subunit c/vacuolar-type H+-ATPase subunit K